MDRSSATADERSCSVVRARPSALFADATVVSSSAAVSFADQPSTSRRISTARCRGGSSWITARNVSSIVSRDTTTASGSCSLGAISSSSRSGYGCSHGTSANECSDGRRRWLRRSASRQAFVAILYSHARRPGPPSKLSR